MSLAEPLVGLGEGILLRMPNKRETTPSAPMKLTAGEEEWIRRIEEAAPTIRQMRERTLKPCPPEPGSSLAADSFGQIDVDGAVWYSMCISVEYLNFIIDALEKMQTLYPTVFMTLSRSALVAAANAHWMVVEKRRVERRRRVLKYKAEGLKQELSALQDFAEVNDLVSRAKTELSKDLDAKFDWLQTQADCAGIEMNVRTQGIKQTRILKNVTEKEFSGTGSDDLLSRMAIMRVWRNGSAAAHGLSQFAAGRFVLDKEDEHSAGNATGRLYADVENDVGPAVLGAFLILNQAWLQYERRKRK